MSKTNDNGIIRQLQESRLIFTVTAGRTGTLLLSELLSLVPGVTAVHEGLPYIDNTWWRLRDNPDLATKWLKNAKLPAILKSMTDNNSTIYVETGHLMSKGFFLPLLDLGIAFDLIILTRPARPTALSFYHLDDIPTRSKSGRRWLLSPDDIGNVSRLPEPYEQYSNYQLAYWYVLESRLRQELHHQHWVDVDGLSVKVKLKELLCRGTFQGFLKEMELPELPYESWREYQAAVHIKHNIKLSRKSYLRTRGHVPQDVQDIDKQELEIKLAIKYDGLLNSIR